MKLNIHYFQHVNYEGLAALQKWVDARGYNLSRTNFKNGEQIPIPDLYDCLIIMGGPMSVHDEDKFPWLVQEKKAIDRALNDGKKVIGICLGAQLLAEALGAKVYNAPFKEVGWLPIQLTEDAKQIKHFAAMPDQFTTFHWHGEMFDIPQNCTRIASSEGCENQIFVYGNSAAGFQCHLEQTEYSIGRMIDRAGDYIKPAKYVQSKEEIIGGVGSAKMNNDLLFTFLDSFCGE